MKSDKDTKYFLYETEGYTLKGIFKAKELALAYCPGDGYHEVRKGQWKDGHIPGWYDMELIKE